MLFMQKSIIINFCNYYTLEVNTAYQQFVEKILEGEEGVFFSVKNDVVGHKTYIGSGSKRDSDFDNGPFPFFSVASWKGDRAYHWNFENFYQNDLPLLKGGVRGISILEDANIDLDLSGLSQYTGETQSSFIKKISALQQLERDGEFWVTNFTQNLSGELSEATDPRLLVLKTFYEFLKLGKNHCGGVVITKEQIFCSLSPETFLIQDQNLLKTFPIKGTGTKNFLKTSIKEISELSMITDLLRNDLGQICESVWLQRERYLTKEQGFYHARAEVQGRLKECKLSWKKYLSLLPAGSITGAPKTRVLKVLAEYESFDRAFYTGTFGVKLSPEKSIFNILIRTLFVDTKTSRWSFPVGAGITIESTPEAEWEETLQKGEILKNCLKASGVETDCV